MGKRNENFIGGLQAKTEHGAGGRLEGHEMMRESIRVKRGVPIKRSGRRRL